jgi:hypothetical protein
MIFTLQVGGFIYYLKGKKQALDTIEAIGGGPDALMWKGKLDKPTDFYPDFALEMGPKGLSWVEC